MRRLAPAAGISVLTLSAAILAQNLLVKQVGDELRVSAPNFHFFHGKPLDRARNGNTVAFDFQLQALGAGKVDVLQRSFERFAISYDLWEQTYSVSRMRGKRGQGAHMTASQVEAWCIENMALPTLQLPKDEPVFVRLEIHAVEGRASDPVFDDAGLSLSSLIEVFSRASRVAKPTDYWKLETGPVRLGQM